MSDNIPTPSPLPSPPINPHSLSERSMPSFPPADSILTADSQYLYTLIAYPTQPPDPHPTPSCAPTLYQQPLSLRPRTPPYRTHLQHFREPLGFHPHLASTAHKSQHSHSTSRCLRPRTAHLGLAIYTSRPESSYRALIAYTSSTHAQNLHADALSAITSTSARIVTSGSVEGGYPRVD